jgi:protein-tyrosine-phosphatase
MSEALLDRASAERTAHSLPAPHQANRVHPEVIEAMAGLGFDLSCCQPKLLTRELAEQADAVVTMGCGDQCPFIPRRHYIDWNLADPSGQPTDQVRVIRDEIDRRVHGLLSELQATPGS